MKITRIKAICKTEKHCISERIAKDMAESPMDLDGKAMEHAKRYSEKAEAIKVMVKIVRALNEAGQE